MLAALLALLLGASCARREGPRELPREFARHVVLVSLGRFRADHLAFTGYVRNTTGHREGAVQRAGALDHTLDVVREQGAAFLRAYVPESSFEVGMAGWLRGACWRGGRLVECERSLAALLREHGWRTVAVTSGLPFDPRSPLLEGFDTSVHVTSPHDVVARVDAEAAQVGTRGLFLWVHLDLPGGATDLLTPELAPYLEELLPAGERAKVALDWAAQEARFAARTPYDALEERTLTASYDARLLHLHDCLRAVLWALSARRSILPDALLAVVGDRGCELGRRDAYLGSRLSAREDALHVPFLLRGPRVPAGELRTDLVEAADLYPTVLRAVDLAAPQGLQGLDLWAARDPARRIEGRSADGARTLRDHRYRLILPPEGDSAAFHREVELYDLWDAAGRCSSSAAVHPALVSELRAHLDA
ncbi:MAG: sulfatase-like hydrolase/transferase [Planctomycetes bacterium]|nr:sulfatase-like hydrolase/transferase [Planctomycetota bacterium]